MKPTEPYASPSRHYRLLHALTEYDRKQARKPHYNLYALGHMVKRLHEVEADMERGADTREAILRGFCGPALTACLRALKLTPATLAERNRHVAYVPVTSPGNES